MKTELTIEESASLIELGVDKKLASMKEFVHIYPEVLKGYAEYAKPWGWMPKFTLTDLLAILPKEIGIEDFEMRTDRGNWVAMYRVLNGSCFFAPELIDALYQLLIWVIENGHITPKTDKQ